MRSSADGGSGRRGRIIAGHPAAARALLHAFVILCVIIDVLLVVTIVRGGGFTHDSYAYWSVDLSAPFTAGVGEKDAFLYSPAAAQLFAVLGHLPWEVFLLGWTAP